MTPFRRPSRSDDHLSNYWNALVRNAPPEELARLARLVEPSDIAAIERARANHTRHHPDPVFARRLEQTLMDTAMSPTGDLAGTIPQPRVSPRSPNGPRDPGPISHRRAAAPPSRPGWTLRPALIIGLAILLVLASAASTWWASNLQDEPQPMMAPAAMQDPEDTAGAAQGYSDHPMVGTWESANGIPCWCISSFAADGLSMSIDPNPESSTSGISSQSVSFGIWQPTGDRTAESVVRFPADDGGYIERTITWEVSEDGNSVMGSGTQRRISPDGKFATMPGSPPIEMVRMTMPGQGPEATPED